MGMTSFIVAGATLSPELGLAEETVELQQFLTAEACKRNTIERAKQDQDIQVKKEISTCSGKYPIFKALTACQIQHLKNKGLGKSQLLKKVKACKKAYHFSSPKPENSLPIGTLNGELFFAGWPLTSKTTLSALQQAGWSCDHAIKSISAPEQRYFNLFGNDPTIFKRLKPLMRKSLLRKYSKRSQDSSSNENYLNIPNIGRLYSDSKRQNPLLFFGTSTCSLNLNHKDVRDIQLHLLNLDDDNFLPFYGLIFYNQTSSAPKLAYANALLTKIVGPPSNHPKEKTKKLFSKEKFVVFDKEGDPKNLCKKPRKHKEIAVLSSPIKQKKSLSYILVANILNLCKYGDLIDPRSKLSL
jgi:hypothetical protein